MFSINKPGQNMPPHPDTDNHQPTHPDKPHPPIGPGHPEHPDKPNEPNEPIIVIVNGVDKTLSAGIERLSYEEVVTLAYGTYNSSSSIIYSIAYSNGPVENKKGVLVKGDSVRIRKGMIFNVGCSNKS